MNNLIVNIGNSLFQTKEKYRLKIHFIKTENFLQKRKLPNLTPQQFHERGNNIERLKLYEKQGKFPINTDYPNQKLPHIKDRYGTYCALAYLIHKSGRDDLVDTLFNEDNNIYVHDVSKGPLINWLDKNGLTKTEAARIQPTYGNYEDPTTTALGWYVIMLLWKIGRAHV